MYKEYSVYKNKIRRNKQKQKHILIKQKNKFKTLTYNILQQIKLSK